MSDQNPRPLTNRPRVLIVDDSATALYLLRTAFENEDYVVGTANDGATGLEEVKQCMPDLIVTDSLMPGLDGFAFLRRLRENPATRQIPVIMLTSGDPHDPEHRKNEFQPDVFVAKSADMKPLLHEVRNLLQRAPSA